ncbi:hypothetical protein [Paraburkholderia sp. 40]|uniref:hypothetical protein n=1 Tax=Paraburkholderia sp. 40 TaxID=2991059 RepID=UPI003D1FD9D5
MSGATGNFGSATVLTALAMGVRQVVTPGRNETVLVDLKQRFGPRIIPVRLSGDGTQDIAAIDSATEGPIDAVLDFLPPSADASVARTAIMAVRPYGRAILMGGVGMLGGDDLSLIKGQWVYEPRAVHTMVGMVRSGQLDLNQFAVTEFALEEVNHAVSHAAANNGPFKLTVVRP